MKSNDKKQKTIQKAKRTNFRQEINKATETPQGLWRLAKWAKDKSHQSREVSKMPMLKFNDQVADTFDQKAEMLKGVFFPAPPPADLSDIEGSFYPTSPHCPIIITKSEVSTALSRLKSDKAPGPDGISNRIRKACSEKLVELLTPLFQACVTLVPPAGLQNGKHNSAEKNRQRRLYHAESLPTNCTAQHAQ